MTRMIASFGFVGYLSPGPGTWGSLAALPILWALHVLTGFPGVAVATVAVIGLGWWAVGRIEAEGDTHDPGWIVIDEVAGMWLALWPVSAGAWWLGVPVLGLWPGWVVGFLAFRLFDIWKPGPVGWADRRPGALGVMLDDLIAGVFAAVVVVLAAALSHGLMRAL